MENFRMVEKCMKLIKSIYYFTTWISSKVCTYVILQLFGNLKKLFKRQSYKRNLVSKINWVYKYQDNR